MKISENTIWDYIDGNLDSNKIREFEGLLNQDKKLQKMLNDVISFNYQIKEVLRKDQLMANDSVISNVMAQVSSLEKKKALKVVLSLDNSFILFLILVFVLCYCFLLWIINNLNGSAVEIGLGVLGLNVILMLSVTILLSRFLLHKNVMKKYIFFYS
ncbi:MAG TPA: hypothetical protein PLS00_00005 [Niabella sp.]|nr:hypothetical protein [Niabella sp.]